MSKKIILPILTVLMIMAFGAPNVGAWEMERIKCKKPEAQKLADELYDLLVSQISKDSYKKAIGLMEKATKIEPDNDRLYVELAADCWEYGDLLPQKTSEEKKIRLKWFNKGKAAAEKALDIKETAGANFWSVVNMAAGGEMVGIMKSLWMFPKMVKQSKRADELDQDYLYGATARFWSEVTARVPDIALRAVGMDPKEPLKQIESQIKKHPLFFENYCFAARYYVRLKKKDKALEKLAFVIKTNPRSAPNKAWHSNNIYNQKEARGLWREFTGKNYPGR